ncbi:lysis protein [Serratia fonticola]|uniref:Lysis protein n=1 Tax=Serratia fonticola TaxID=47917 RepID=A0ABY9PGK2_SERFO|nr:lysis protein [Serratia fonticola]WMT12537.1 lysis protein [Serratia fonticola]
MTWPLPHWQAAIVAVVLGLLAYFAISNQGLRHERTDLLKTNGQLSQTVRIQQDMQIRASAIDAQRYKELTNAKNQIADLQRAVADGVIRLRLNATCTDDTTTGTSSLANGSGPRLTQSAERDYFTLRERIETASSQIAGLQDYIIAMRAALQTCLNPTRTTP